MEPCKHSNRRSKNLSSLLTHENNSNSTGSPRNRAHFLEKPLRCDDVHSPRAPTRPALLEIMNYFYAVCLPDVAGSSSLGNELSFLLAVNVPPSGSQTHFHVVSDSSLEFSSGNTNTRPRKMLLPTSLCLKTFCRLFIVFRSGTNCCAMRHLSPCGLFDTARIRQ